MAPRLRHEYFRIYAGVIWLVLVEHLPRPHEATKAIIAEEMAEQA